MRQAYMVLIGMTLAALVNVIDLHIRVCIGRNGTCSTQAEDTP